MLRAAFAVTLLVHACTGDETVSGHAAPGAVYSLQGLDGAPPPARVTLGFPEQGAVSLATPCGRYTGRQTAPYPWFEVVDLALADPAPCSDAAARGTATVIAALAGMSLAETLGDVLVLSNDAGGEMAFSGGSPERGAD